MNEIYLYVGIGSLIILGIGLLKSKRFKGKLTKKGLTVEADNTSKNDTTKIKNIKNKSEVDIENSKNRDVEINKVDNSTIKIRK